VKPFFEFAATSAAHPAGRNRSGVAPKSSSPLFSSTSVGCGVESTTLRAGVS